MDSWFGLFYFKSVKLLTPLKVNSQEILAQIFYACCISVTRYFNYYWRKSRRSQKCVSTTIKNWPRVMLILYVIKELTNPKSPVSGGKLKDSYSGNFLSCLQSFLAYSNYILVCLAYLSYKKTFQLLLNKIVFLEVKCVSLWYDNHLKIDPILCKCL